MAPTRSILPAITRAAGAERKRYCRGVGGGEKEEGAEGDGGEKEETSCCRCRCIFEAPRKSPSPADNDSSLDIETGKGGSDQSLSFGRAPSKNVRTNVVVKLRY
uniref:Uncharacterized protein n=1 Tax=Plectus sambesii TaxID=2011161 RepID=A0A914UN05_9BILA